MRNVLQLVGVFLGFIIAASMCVYAIAKFSTSKKTEIDEKWLFEGLLRGSATGVSICLIFVLISQGF